MSTLTRSESSRINGAKSRGPVTAEGKARSSRNAIKHGLNSKLVVLEGEDHEAFDQLRDSYIRSLRPTNQVQAGLVEALASAKWRMDRVVVLETELFEKHMKESPGEFALATAFEHMCQEPTMALLLRYEGQLSRLFDRTLKELQQLKKEERQEAEAQRNEPQQARWVGLQPDEIDPEPPQPDTIITPTNPTPPVQQLQEAAKAA